MLLLLLEIITPTTPGQSLSLSFSLSLSLSLSLSHTHTHTHTPSHYLQNWLFHAASALDFHEDTCLQHFFAHLQLLLEWKPFKDENYVFFHFLLVGA